MDYNSTALFYSEVVESRLEFYDRLESILVRFLLVLAFLLGWVSCCLWGLLF